MTKRDIILKVSAKTGIKQVVVKEIIQSTLETIFDYLKEGKNIELRNFGVFKVITRKAKVGRNPKTGKVFPVPERKIVVFKQGLEMKKSITNRQ